MNFILVKPNLYFTFYYLYPYLYSRREYFYAHILFITYQYISVMTGCHINWSARLRITLRATVNALNE